MTENAATTPVHISLSSTQQQQHSAEPVDIEDRGDSHRSASQIVDGGIAVEINESGYQQYYNNNRNINDEVKRPVRAAVNNNYAQDNVNTAENQSETNFFMSNKKQTGLINNLYQFYWRSQAAAHNRYNDASHFPLLHGQMPHWLWTTWTFLASWVAVVQCRIFSPWTANSLGGYTQPSGNNIQDGNVESRNEIFVQNLVRAIEANDQTAFVRLLSDSVDTGRNQACLNSPVGSGYRGKPVLHYAVRFQRTEMVEILLAHCAEYCVVNNKPATPITTGDSAALTETALESEVHAYYASLVDDGGNNALHEMARFAYVDERMMRLLLAHGCQPSERNMRGYTCAQEALQQNNVKFCLTLCDVWPQAKYKLMQEVIATAAATISGSNNNNNNNRKAVAAVLQLLNGLLVVEQFDGAAALDDALSRDKNSSFNNADGDVGRFMVLDIDLNRVDAEKPVNVLHEALRTGLIDAATSDGSSHRSNNNSNSLKSGDDANAVAKEQKQLLLKLLLRNARVNTNVCDENFTKANQHLWNDNTSNNEQTSKSYDDIDAYLQPASPQHSSGTSKSVRAWHSQQPQKSSMLDVVDLGTSQADLSAYFEPPNIIMSRSAVTSGALGSGTEIFNHTQNAEAWAWLHAVCPKLDLISAIAHSRIHYDSSDFDAKQQTLDDEEMENNTKTSKNGKIICTVNLLSHHYVSSVMLTAGPLCGTYKARLFSLPSNSYGGATAPQKPKSSNKKLQHSGELLGECPKITFPGISSPSFRVKYRLSAPQRVKNILLVLTPSYGQSLRLLKMNENRRAFPGSIGTEPLPSDISVFGIEENLRRLMFEQLRLGKPQIIELLRSGINSSDTLLSMPRFRLRHLLSKSGCRMPATTRMLDFVDTLANGEACPVSRIEWLVQPPRVGWEMRDIGSQMVVLTIDESNKWSRITRSIDVELLISSERGGPPLRRVTRVDVPRLIEAGHLLAKTAAFSGGGVNQPAAARRVVAEFSDIQLPYGNYKLLARLKRKPTLTACNPDHVLEIKVAYYGGDGSESVIMYPSSASARANMPLAATKSYFETQSTAKSSSSSSSSAGWLDYVVSWLPGLEENDNDGTDSEVYSNSNSASPTSARAAVMHGAGFQSDYSMFGTAT